MKKPSPWLPVVGGPRDGSEFLPPDDGAGPRRVAIDPAAEERADGWYCVNAAGTRVEWEGNDG
jgi:hypothetical protein